MLITNQFENKSVPELKYDKNKSCLYAKAFVTLDGCSFYSAYDWMKTDPYLQQNEQHFSLLNTNMSTAKDKKDGIDCWKIATSGKLAINTCGICADYDNPEVIGNYIIRLKVWVPQKYYIRVLCNNGYEDATAEQTYSTGKIVNAYSNINIGSGEGKWVEYIFTCELTTKSTIRVIVIPLSGKLSAGTSLPTGEYVWYLAYLNIYKLPSSEKMNEDLTTSIKMCRLDSAATTIANDIIANECFVDGNNETTARVGAEHIFEFKNLNTSATTKKTARKGR